MLLSSYTNINLRFSRGEPILLGPGLLRRNSIQLVDGPRFSFPDQNYMRDTCPRGILDGLNLFCVCVITRFTDWARWIFELTKHNCKIGSSNFFTIRSTKDTTIMADVLEQRFMIFFTRWILPISHFEKNFVKYFCLSVFKHNSKIKVCESRTFHFQEVLRVPLCLSVSIYTTYNL